MAARRALPIRAGPAPVPPRSDRAHGLSLGKPFSAGQVRQGPPCGPWAGSAPPQAAGTGRRRERPERQPGSGQGDVPGRVPAGDAAMRSGRDFRRRTAVSLHRPPRPVPKPVSASGTRMRFIPLVVLRPAACSRRKSGPREQRSCALPETAGPPSRRPCAQLLERCSRPRQCGQKLRKPVMISALTKSMKNAPTSGATRNARGATP